MTRRSDAAPGRVRQALRRFNFKGELFSSTFAYGASAVIKLASSLVLTRLLSPESYGVAAILYSVTFILELMSDAGTVPFVVRHPRGKEPRFIHAVWTVGLTRACMNWALLYAVAPWIAAVYAAPALSDALRVYSFTFLLGGLQSMSYVMAQRDQRSRLATYTELGVSLLSTSATIALAFVFRDHYAFIYGILLHHAVSTCISHFYYRDVGVALVFDREALRDQLAFARVIWPSSLLTIALSQYDKIVLLKLFDLSVLGIYGIATSLVAPVTGLLMKNSRIILFARCAAYFRNTPAEVKKRYYTENQKLFLIGALLPAMLAGLAPALVTFLYSARYAEAGSIAALLAIGVIMASFEYTSENLLVAGGRTRVVLIINVIRVLTMPAMSLVGYHFFGLNGFIAGGLLSGLIVVVYLFDQQRRAGLFDGRAERRRLAWAAGTFAISGCAGYLLLQFMPHDLITHWFRRH